MDRPNWSRNVLMENALEHNPWDYQEFMDSSPEGSVGAPSGVQPNPNSGPTGKDPVENVLALGSFLPGLGGDLLGPLTDLRAMQQDPDKRTLANLALFGMGALPAVPSLMWMMNRASDSPIRRGIFGNQSGALGYHGTPHDIQQFDSSKIGTGEGAQAYGHGIYIAENKNIAEGYAKRVPYQALKRDFLDRLPEDADFEDVTSLLGKGHFTANQEKVLKELDKEDWLGFDYPSQAISAAYSKNRDNWDLSPNLVDALDSSGIIYTVDISDEKIERMLDWDKPIGSQPELRRAIINNGLLKRIMRFHPDKDLDALTGKELVTSLGKNKEASDLLREAGIPGIKYLDAPSRKKGAGTRNFVIFDDKDIKIINKGK